MKICVEKMREDLEHAQYVPADVRRSFGYTQGIAAVLRQNVAFNYNLK